MKHLHPSILEDYEIPLNRPKTLRMLQFGLDPALLGLADRLIDDANRAGADFGLAVTGAMEPELLRLLREQEGLYTVFVRGEKDNARVNLEQVPQCILRVLDMEEDDAALMDLAGCGTLQSLLLWYDPAGEHRERDRTNEAAAARFLAECWRRGRGPMAVVVCAEDAEAPAEVLGRMKALAESWRAPEAFTAYLESCRFLPCLADCLTFRAEAKEAALLCGRMNYLDGMIHIAEPWGEMRVGGPAEGALPVGFTEALAEAEDLAERRLLKHRLFDVGLFTLTATGLIRGDRTLFDCMKDEPLRELAGRAMTDEVLPALPLPREKAGPFVIRCYERYMNAMNDNRLEAVGRGLIPRFLRGVLPVYALREREGLPLPERLTVALSCAILLLSDVRPGPGGWQTVLEGQPVDVHEAPEVLRAFSRLSSDMDPDSLAYAALSDRDLWDGRDLRDFDGLAEAVAANLSN